MADSCASLWLLPYAGAAQEAAKQLKQARASATKDRAVAEAAAADAAACKRNAAREHKVSFHSWSKRLMSLEQLTCMTGMHTAAAGLEPEHTAHARGRTAGTQVALWFHALFGSAGKGGAFGGGAGGCAGRTAVGGSAAGAADQGAACCKAAGDLGHHIHPSTLMKDTLIPIP